MRYIDVTSLPTILFAHFYRADSYQARFAPRGRTMEITYISEGTLLRKTPGEEHLVKKGDVVCSLRDVPTVVETDNPHCHHTVGVRIDWTFLSDEEGLLLPTVTPAERNTANICRLIDEFAYNQNLYTTSRALGAAKFLELLCAIDQCNRQYQSSVPVGESLYVKRAKDYIQKNIHTPITQTAIAQHLGISPEYLCAVFKKTEGTTVMRYMNKAKLENIKSLIDNANLHLYEAAAIYGYTDPNYVSRLYKQLYGYNITDKPPNYPKITQAE